MTRTRLLAYGALLLNTFFWALAVPVAKIGFDHGLNPTTFLLARFLIAALASLPIVLLLNSSPIKNKKAKPLPILKIILLETLGTTISLSLLYQGVAHTSATEASLLSITWPIFVTLGGIIFLREKEQRNELLGLVLAIFGTFLLILEPILDTKPQPGHLYGNFLIIGQNLTIAAYYLLAKKAYTGLNKWLVTHISFWVGFIGLALMSSYQGTSPLPSLTITLFNPNPWHLIPIFYMAICGSILALTLYLYGQEKIEASEAALFTYLQPLFSIPASILLLGESVTLLQLFAIGLVLVGVVAAERR